MSRHGIVIETHDDKALISSLKRGVCESCTEKDSCSLEDSLQKDVPQKVSALNPLGAQPGDQVEFNLQGHTELKLSLIVWTVPIIGLLLGAILGSKLSATLSMTPDSAALIGSIIGFAVFTVPMMIYDRLVSSDPSLMPVITKVNPVSCAQPVENPPDQAEA